MKINVDINNLKIIDKDQLESGEYNVTDLEFIFSPEYENLQKVAIFGCNLESEDPKYYKVILHDDKCIIPEEVLHKTGQIIIGCYAYEINGEELIRRYSPVPIKIIVEQGSFRDNFENVTPPTPTELEQIQAQINQIEAKIIIINNTLHIYDNNFQTVNEAINDINEKIDEIEGDLADTYSKQEIDDKFSEVNEALEDKVDTTVFEESQNAQDEKIAKAELILSQLPKVTGEGTNISLSPTIEYDLEVGSLKGDTTQNTLTGKNKLPSKFGYTNTINGTTLTIDDEGVITISGTNGSGINILFELDNTYTIQSGDYFHMGNDIATTNVSFSLLESDNTNIAGAIPSSANRIFDLAGKEGRTIARISIYHNASWDGSKITFKPMIVNSSTATSYEPYCGGIPSPNPNYPQDIQVVTGTQTVTISNADNTESQTYTLHLGDIELAKIGSYKDKIFIAEEGNEVYDSLTQEQKANLTLGKWYKYGAIGKVALNGSEEYTKIRDYVFSTNLTNALFPTNTSELMLEYCNYYTGVSNSATWNNYDYLLSYSSGRIVFRNKDTKEISDFKTWLSTHNTIVYYVLLTSTSTEITNNTLLSDLEYIRTHAMSYSGATNISTSGNLPIIITASTLKQLS